ncbi:TIGR00266 family protein [Thomasclavelia sp.]|uniref:TIGR00266 family protein n=1 Tax=Thomasclavelia sp. TaxID=3025757 RepID=UPI0025CC381D|nr:TIGR00266 family protein [Thomasclavelia sp.]
MKYEIKGGNLPVVICHLEKGESMTTDSGAMSWMDPVMKMETVSGGVGKAFGRMFSGETMFQNRYTANDDGMIAFASSFPGSIKAVNIDPNHEIIIQKSTFLASTQGVEMSVFFNKKVGTGFFGGEGFIMNKISGNGLVFLEIDGTAIEYDLLPGQQMVIDTGYLAMMDATCKMEIQSVKGMKNKFLGGEGFFNTVITGPGKIVLQSMPISAVASVISPFIPTGK